MSYLDALSHMWMILFAIALGFVADRLGYMGGEFNTKLTKLLLNLGLPCMIVSAVLTSENLPGLQDILNILLVAVVFYVLAFVAAFLLPLVLRPPKKEIGTYRFILSFTNVGFVGYPVVGSLFGSDCVFYAAVLALPFNLLLYTLGPVMLSGGKGGKLSWKGVFSPCMLASLAALIVALTHLRFPVAVVESLDFIGDMSIPLALMLLGSILAALPLGQMLGSPRMWLLTALRLLAMPALLYAALLGLEVDELLRNIAVVQMGLPVATNGVLLAMQYGGDTDSMAQGTFLTTVASLATIPLVASLIL
jgi:predicted permease